MSYKDESSTVLVLCEQCWQSVVEPHLAGKLFNQGVEAQLQLLHIHHMVCHILLFRLLVTIAYNPANPWLKHDKVGQKFGEP